MLFVVSLNFFSFFYTKNYYYTNVAVTLHLTCLLFMYLVSLHLSGRTAYWLLFLTALSGVLVSIETWFQFYDKSVLFKWMTPGSMLIGTIGIQTTSARTCSSLSLRSRRCSFCSRESSDGSPCLVDLRFCSAPFFERQAAWVG